MHAIRLEAVYFHVVTHTLEITRKAAVQRPKHVEEKEEKNKQYLLPFNIDHSCCLLQN
jgi:hypothetical protein